MLLLKTSSISPWFGHYLLFSNVELLWIMLFRSLLSNSIMYCFPYINKLVMSFMWLLSALFCNNLIIVFTLAFISNKQTKTSPNSTKDWLRIKRRIGFCSALCYFWVSSLKPMLWLHNILHLTVEEEIVFSPWPWESSKAVLTSGHQGNHIKTHNCSSVIIQLSKE